MNEREMVRFAAFLTVRWPSRPRDEMWARAWLDDFAPYSFDDAVAAARRWRSEGKIAPEGDDLLALIYLSRPARQLTVMEFCGGLAQRLVADGYDDELIVKTIEQIDGVSLETAARVLEAARPQRQIGAAS